MSAEMDRGRWDPATGGGLVAGGQHGPAIVVHFSLSFSLYQMIVSAAHRETAAVSGARGAEAWKASADRVRPLVTPFGSLSLFEAAIAGTGHVREVRPALKLRAAAVVDDLAAAIDEAAPHYVRALWPEHRAVLESGLGDLERLLVPHADALLERISRDLALPRQPECYDVYLVPTTYQPAGAYSHPTVVSVERFQGAELLEAVMHEVAHVMAGLNRFDLESAFGVLKRLCAAEGLAPDVPFRLFHLLLFQEAGELVRAQVPNYVPYALRHDMYASSSSQLPGTVTGDQLAEIWADRISGRQALEATLERLVTLVAPTGAR